MPSETQLREIFDALGDGVFVADGQGAYIDVNRAACAMLGYSKAEILQLSLADLLDASEWKRLPTAIASYRDGAVQRSEWRFKRKDGTIFADELVGGRLPDGRFQSVVRDISVSKERERHEQVLVQEATHRTKNILALVQAIGRQTASASPEDFVAAFGQRIAALAASHTLFVTSAWQPIDLETLIRAQLAPFAADTGRIRISGPAIDISPAAAQSLGMALHELATNAAKHGSLSNPAGSIDIRWAIERGEPKDSFALVWSERDGPLVGPPTRTGFGTRMIAHMIQRALSAETTLEFASTGLQWRFTSKLDAIAKAPAHDDDTTLAALAAPAPQPAPERRILFLDDSETCASLMEAVASAGMKIAARVFSPNEVLAQLAASTFDAAVLALGAMGDQGPQVLTSLKSAHKPVIIVLDEAEPAPELGFDASFIRRPVKPATLVSRLAILIQSVS